MTVQVEVFSMLIVVFKDKNPQKAPIKQSVQPTSSSASRDIPPPQLPGKRPLKEEKEVVKGSSKAVSGAT